MFLLPYLKGPEECHDKTVDTLVDVPEEQCDLNPQKTCRFETKLVPKLSPKHECTIVPQEICNLKFSQPRQVPKPLQTRWCLDPTPAAPGDVAAVVDPKSGLLTPSAPGHSYEKVADGVRLVDVVNQFS